MHPELEALAALWAEDQALDRLTDELAALHARVEACKGELVSARAAHEVLVAERAALKERDHALSRRLDTYVKRRDRTQQQLDAGIVSDFLVAQKQLSECTDIVDEIETDLLELYEEIEDCDGRMDRSLGGVELRELKLREATSALDTRSPGLHAEITVQSSTRDDARTHVRGDYLSRYGLLIEKGREPISALRGADCGGCFKRIPQERLEAHKRAVSVQTCPSCSRFLGALS